MKWTLKLERIDEAGNLHSTTVAYVERPELTSEADLGLTHDDGKYLLPRVQAEVAQEQVRTLISKIRPCLACGRLRSIKEHRRRRLDTVFGHLRIHAPRFEACVCGRSAASSPMAALFPHRSTPELRHLQVKLGCKFSYQQAADILNEFLPDLSCFNHATTRNRVLAVGKTIEAETRAEIVEKPSVEKPVEHMIVGIDGAFVKATRSKNQRKNFEIVLGRIEASGCQEKIFAAVHDLDDLARERVRSALRSAGRGSATKLTVLSDGEDAMRLMAGQWLNGRVEHRLDWFHLRRRIQWLGRSIYWTIDYGEPAYEQRLARYRNLRSVRWNVWHYGKSRRCCPKVERSFAWATRCRRLVNDYERYAQTLVGLHVVAFACFTLRRAAELMIHSAQSRSKFANPAGEPVGCAKRLRGYFALHFFPATQPSIQDLKFEMRV